jgi:FkbM family methyltransferase
MAKIVADCLVGFYKLWHGRLHLPGSGFLLRFFARSVLPLQNYPVAVPGVGIIPLDFRMDFAFLWTNFLLNESHREEGLLLVLASHFSPDGVFWDIGANIGLISGNLVRSFPSAAFYLFEPNPDLTRRLARLFSTRKNVAITETALSDQNGRAHFNIAPGFSSTATLLPGHHANAAVIDVELQTGDRFLSTHTAGAPSLIKIDVEGHELEVLRGCRELVATHRPVIVFEHLFLSDDAIKSLVPPGYDLLYIHDQSGTCSPVLDRNCSHNAILIPSGKRQGNDSGPRLPDPRP